MVAQRLTCCIAEPKGTGALGLRCFLDAGDKQKRLCVEVSAHAKDLQEVKINPDPSTVALSALSPITSHRNTDCGK